MKPKGTLTSNKEEKVRRNKVPWELEGGMAGCVDGGKLPAGLGRIGVACLGSPAGPACLSLHFGTAELVCPVLGER